MNHIPENKNINTFITKKFKATINGPIDVNNVVVMENKYEIAKKKNLSYWEQIKEKFGGKQKSVFQESNNINIIFEDYNKRAGKQNIPQRLSFSKLQDAIKQDGVAGAFRTFTNKPITNMEDKTNVEDLPHDKDSIVRQRKLSDSYKANEKPKQKFIIDKIKEIARPRTDKSSSAIKLKEMCNLTTDEYIKLDEYVDVIPAGQKGVVLHRDDDNNPTTVMCALRLRSREQCPDNTEESIGEQNIPKNIDYNIDKDDISLLTEIKYHEETQYTNLIREIMNNGYDEFGRNGDTLTKFGYSMRFSLRDGTMPILTTKKLAWRVCFEELFWFIRGETNNKKLQEKNVHIWDQNSSREFLDSRGLYYLEEGDLGPIYGFQWRHFNAEYAERTKCYQGEGVDQLEQIIETLKNPETRTSRRMIMTAWNPCQLNYMALPPCHILAQFHVRENKYLSCALYQRSGDVGLGVPFNIASYSLLTHILAKHCGLEADEFIHFLGNCHIYKEHIMPLKQQIKLEPMAFPKIEITTTHDSIDDYCLDDISWIQPYKSHPAIKMLMKA